MDSFPVLIPTSWEDTLPPREKKLAPPEVNVEDKVGVDGGGMPWVNLNTEKLFWG